MKILFFVLEFFLHIHRLHFNLDLGFSLELWIQHIASLPSSNPKNQKLHPNEYQEKVVHSKCHVVGLKYFETNGSSFIVILRCSRPKHA